MGPDYMEGLISKMRAIHNPVTSFKRGKAQRPSSRQPSPGALTGGPDRKLPGLHLLSGGATSPSVSINRRLFFPILAVLAALALSLLFLLPGGLLQAQETSEAFYYHEKDTGPVVTLSASDPERVTPIVWSLPAANVDPDGDGPLTTGDTQDNGDFKINAAGELSFGTSPDYETPADEGTNNTYNAVVQASDGGVATWVEYFKVTVTVLDVEETGTVEWTVDPDGSGAEPAGQDLLEFQAGAILIAVVTDPDSVTSSDTDGDITTGITWRWYRSSSMSALGTVISNEGGVPVETATYTVSDEADSNDVGMYLRAVATYTDRRGANKTAEFVSVHPVRPAKVQQNSLPEFAPTSIEREVQEGPTGMVVGAPVTATDADGDVRNYTLVDGNDAARFAIDQATGQITTNVALDYEDPSDTGGTPSDNIHVVIVHATDSAGGESAADATVTITLLDVNEAPAFDADDGTANIAGMAADRPEEGVGNHGPLPTRFPPTRLPTPRGSRSTMASGACRETTRPGSSSPAPMTMSGRWSSGKRPTSRFQWTPTRTTSTR